MLRNQGMHTVRWAGWAALLVALVAAGLAFSRGREALGAEVSIVVPPNASRLETLAAREVLRYVYLRTGSLPSLVAADAPPAGEAVVIARKDRALVAAAADAETKAAAEALKTEQFVLKTSGQPRRLLVVGGDDVGVLYGAYRVAERLGVRFYLHGDVVPDGKIALALPDLNEVDKPFFDIRGINPFHDFPEGPDWWNQDDYLVYVAQLAKMRMNFLGLHCYPEGGVGPEPAVWIGVPGDLEADGRVRFSYPSQWANTKRVGMWGYAAMSTSDFCAGAAALFEADAFGPAVQDGMMPRPNGPEASNELFNRTAGVFRAAFAQARGLGVKTCIGTETPLTIPRLVKERLKQQGKNPADPAVVKEVYEGIFRRIAAGYPVDYYWLWTPEDWTWGGNKPAQFEATVSDLQAALGALDTLKNPFMLATCGWVLGPQHDRAALDKVLPKQCPMSCINREVGHAPVEPGFANVAGRPKWAIPWMENDPDLIAPQPWVGRMRYDAADARRLGCTGLLGIHWRTKMMGPNVSALAWAAWDQSWIPAGFDVTPVAPKPAVRVSGPQGGNTARFTAPVAGTEDAPVYQAVRYNMPAYNYEVPNGTYTVTLKLNEPHYGEAGKRVFGVKLQGQQVIDKLDLFAKVGKNKALDYTFPDIAVKDGWLAIEFVNQVEFACIAGIVIESKSANPPYVRKINCGGDRYKDYEADADAPQKPGGGRDRTMPVEDFYADFARASFGEEAGEAVGKILAKTDGVKLPEPSTWINGPGGIKVDKAPWDQAKARYGFVEEWAALRASVKGVGNLERFDYWLNTFRYMAAMAQAGCCRGRLDDAVAAVNAEKDPARKKELAEKALPLRLELARVWERMIAFQVAATDTPGELGTLANLEQHNRKQMRLLDGHDEALRKVLGAGLPPEFQLTAAYSGPARIIVPTVRTLAAASESLTLKVIVMTPNAGKEDAAVPAGELFWRPLGKGEFSKVPMTHVARRVFQVKLPPIPTGTAAIEYYIQAACGDVKLLFPATAPDLNQTVVVSEVGEK